MKGESILRYAFGLVILLSVSALSYDHVNDRAENASTPNQIQGWREKIEREEDLKKDEKRSQYLQYDFATLLTPRSAFLGYIGTGYRRLKVHFYEVRKDPEKPDTYVVKGKTTVAQNACDFSGAIVIDSIRERKKIPLGVDDELKDAGLKAAGVLFGRYKFKEDEKAKHAGIFEGIVTVNWYVDKAGKILYDDIGSYSDGFCNNQYVGTWLGYGAKELQVANWGEYRIPFSDELDIGAGEFSAAGQFVKQGWEDQVAFQWRMDE